jgi:hypothetical protein
MLVNSRRPWAASSRPWPEAFTPPNGSAGKDATMPLMNVCPAARSRMNRSCSPASWVQALEPRPNLVAFASSTASSTSAT